VNPSIEVENLSHAYVRRAQTLEILRGVTFSANKASYLSLVGPSGSGKTTLLSILGGLEQPQSGGGGGGGADHPPKCVAGHDLATMAGDRLAEYRQKTVGFVFQHFGLLEALTAFENLELALTLSGTPAARRRLRAHELLARVGLSDRLDHRPFELSGGERQRVAIARALANGPELVLADEPTGNLDDDTAASVIDLLESLPAEHGCTLLVVTHNRALAARARTRLTLVDGQVQTDTSTEVSGRHWARPAGPVR